MSAHRSGRYRVPYLRESQIEREAQSLLDEWMAKGHLLAVPVPLDDLVELHLGLSFEVEDLRARFESRDVLGAIWFNENVIRVDSSLDPRRNPSMLGRFNFTLAHEIGHWRIHRAHLRADPNEACLFDANGRAAFVCRDGDRAPEEWQADQFAGCLLMPRQLLRDAWVDWRGDDRQVAVSSLDIPTELATPQANENLAMERFCRPLAERFAVSAAAMRIRLEALELLVSQVEPRLF
ncbi:MAG: ImmA/IrrE family metallo-endopeptidase [Phycisphaerae bacterium]|nr:ImmA/IrrE family metallo-endopeptidase [Phycisphaerae bacterium]